MEPFTDKCLQVVLHEGTPSGSFRTVQGHRIYVATPSGSYAKDAAVMICTDLFGVDLVNNLLIADSFAAAGFQTYLPDYLNSDSVPHDLRQHPEKYPDFDMASWRSRHTAKEVRPALDACVEMCKTEGVRKLFCIGYCYGARFAVDLAYEGVLQAVALAHPSQLNIPDDLNQLITLEPKTPMLFLTCERDQAFPIESQEKADAILGGLGKHTYKKVYYADADHGFAVRGDLSKPNVKRAKEDAFKQAVEWFRQHDDAGTAKI